MLPGSITSFQAVVTDAMTAGTAADVTAAADKSKRGSRGSPRNADSRTR
jgi:hypothetical protein